MDESSRRLVVVIGAIAAAAGVATASYLLIRRAPRSNHADRNVTEILMDCYAKVKEIQNNLTDLHAATLRTAPSKS